MIDPPPLRILMTADAVGGVWQYATDLSAALIERGHRVTLALLGPPASPDQRRLAARISGLQLIETGLPLDWLASRPEEVESAAVEIAALARSERADVVHCNTPALAGAAQFPVPLVAVTHGCVATWWQEARGTPLAPAFRWHREMTDRGLAAAETVVSPSAGYAAVVKQTYALSSLPLVVHNGRKPGERPREDAPQLRAALTVGRLWDPAKNAVLLDKAAAALKVPIFAAGALGGPHGEAFAPLHLQPLGQLDDAALAAILAHRPVFVSSATFEPFGLAVLEAASAGCALVLSDIPTFRELWDGAAVFADPADERSFAAAITGLIDDPERRLALGKAASARAARFTPAAVADAMCAIYAALLQRQEEVAA